MIFRLNYSLPISDNYPITFQSTPKNQASNRIPNPRTYHLVFIALNAIKGRQKQKREQNQSNARHQLEIQTLSQSVRNFIYLLIICTAVTHTSK